MTEAARGGGCGSGRRGAQLLWESYPINSPITFAKRAKRLKAAILDYRSQLLGVNWPQKERSR